MTVRSITSRSLVLLLFAAAALPSAGAARADGVLVFAAASTTDALGAVIESYRKATGKPVRVSFAASSALARQIASGAPAQIYISANERWMDWLASRRLIDKRSRRDLLRNSLVLVAPRQSAVALSISPGFPLAAALNKGRLAVADPDHVPAGLYAHQALSSLGVWSKVAARTARTRDVRAALALVERAETPLGIVYATDARASAGVRVVDRFPPASHAPIVYPAALVAAHTNPAAQHFDAYLNGAVASRIFARFGFIAD